MDGLAFLSLSVSLLFNFFCSTTMTMAMMGQELASSGMVVSLF
jgi:hypothetical protein